MTSTRTTSRGRERSGCSRLPSRRPRSCPCASSTKPDHATLVGLDARLREDVFPEVADRLNDVRVPSGPESSPGGVVARSLLADWSEFVTLANSRAFLAATEGPSDDDRTISSTVARLSTSLGILTEQLQAQEVQQAQQAKREAERTYAHSLSVLRTIVALGLLAGVSATLWLIRSVVVRTKEYSRFAMRIAAGELHTRIRPRGHDELTDLGWALNEMVARGEAARVYETTQREFTDALQVSETEGDTYGLLKRHLERSIPGARSWCSTATTVRIGSRRPPSSRPSPTRGAVGDGAAPRLSGRSIRSAARRGAGRGAVDRLRPVPPPRRSDVVQPAPGGWGGDRVGPVGSRRTASATNISCA